MSPTLQVAWKTATWLLFNGGAQALPVLYLSVHGAAESKAFWEYVNCTLALLIAVGMLFAAISDLVTENGRIHLFGWGALAVIVVIALAFLHRTIHDEFLKRIQADWELFLGSIVVALAIVSVGTFLKMKMWYDEAVGDDED